MAVPLPPVEYAHALMTSAVLVSQIPCLEVCPHRLPSLGTPPVYPPQSTCKAPGPGRVEEEGFELATDCAPAQGRTPTMELTPRTGMTGSFPGAQMLDTCCGPGVTGGPWK